MHICAPQWEQASGKVSSRGGSGIVHRWRVGEPSALSGRHGFDARRETPASGSQRPLWHRDLTFNRRLWLAGLGVTADRNLPPNVCCSINLPFVGGGSTAAVQREQTVGVGKRTGIFGQSRHTSFC